MSPEPDALGATWTGAGTSFVVWSDPGEGVDLCLFDPAGGETRVPLSKTEGGCWHGHLPGIGPGQRYGYRVHGPADPSLGLRFNAAKLLLDPYARAVDGEVTLHEALFDNELDSAPYVPRSVVVHDDFDWAGDRPPAVPWAETVIYELHVRGFTARHPGVPEELRGTYAGLGHPVAVEHVKSLGVTAVELLPVHQFASEPALLRRGLRNYWGYNTLGFFAPHAAYSAAGSSGQQVPEFKAMVRSLHAAGIEVILDVVYNHTAEGAEDGPTLSFRGLDNAAYYRLRSGDRARYADVTGCGNTLDLRQPPVRRMVIDSLRYWVSEMHVDGFRFDLAPALARSTDEVDLRSSLFAAVNTDPVLSGVKLLAEPWDLGAGGYQVGRFPAPWSEWNDRYRDAVRSLWSGRPVGTHELGLRLSGSSDLYEHDGRRPYASINYVTAHDGFTLADLVTYERKHNADNGEDNRDGTEDNRSWNCGVEGASTDPAVNTLRRRQIRNLLTTLLMSTGVPMITAGDELRRTQHGNNNAYCHDDESTWLDWNLDPDADALLAFTRRLVALRAGAPALRRPDFCCGRIGPDGAKELAWFGRDGAELTDGHSASARTLGMYLDGATLQPVADSYLVVLHAGEHEVSFRLPGLPWAATYDVLLDTTAEGGGGGATAAAGTDLGLTARSVTVLRAHRPAPAQCPGDQ